MKIILFLTVKSNVRKAIMASLMLFWIGYSSTAYAQSPGSGNALSFDGNDDGLNNHRRVDLPNILAASYTKEAWVNAPLNNVFANTNNIISGTATAFWFPQGQGYRLSAGHTFPFTEVQDPTPLTANTWYHVAVTYDAATTTMNLYKNGVLVSSNNAVPNHTESTLYIGAYIAANYMKGLIDEVRIWNVALSQSQIRDWMCKKVTLAHPQWANLVGYYNGDEATGNTVTDIKNGNDGSFVNGNARQVSGAAIGNESSHDYVNTTKTASVANIATGETFTATSTSGSPTAIHVYRVDDVPNSLTGTTGVGNNDKYFGVFQVGGSSPQYTGVYYYSSEYGGIENSLQLFKRADNSAASWSNASATLNTTANTLTVTGQSTEYILGNSLYALPVKLTSFTARQNDNKVKLDWITASEINNAGFFVQRLHGNGSDWQDLGFIASANSNTTSQTNYTYTDPNPVSGANFYRLKQIDIDGHITFSDIKKVNFLSASIISLYPIPTNDELRLTIASRNLINTKAQILDISGKSVSEFIITNYQEFISLKNLRSGLYILKVADGSSYRIVKQ